MTEQIDLAYLAGIIDGEGSINISCNPKHGRNYYSLKLDITNTSDALMQWLEDKFRGHIGTSYARSQNRTNLHSWIVSGKQAQYLLYKVLPYLVIKTEQALLALTLDILPYGGACRWNYTEEEEFNRSQAYEEMKRLNSLGGNKGRYLRDKSKALKGGECLAFQS